MASSGEMEALVQVALQCVEEDKNARPTMSPVFEMLSYQEKDLVPWPTKYDMSS